MNGSTASTDEAFLRLVLKRQENRIETVEAAGLPAGHPAEADAFVRQAGTPGFDQEALKAATFVLVGAGGLNSWVGLVLARSGAQRLVIVDGDWVDRTNLHRQFYFAEDLGQSKSISLAHNLAPHLLAGGQVTAIRARLEDAIERFAFPADVLIVGVDRNDCRMVAARLARRRRISAVFTMLSSNGMRVQSFLQGPFPGDACLWCALPNLDPESSLACVPALMTTCLLAAGLTTFFALRTLMGWPAGVEPYNWREADLLGIAPDSLGWIPRRVDCPVCSPFM